MKYVDSSKLRWGGTLLHIIRNHLTSNTLGRRYIST